MFASVCDVTAGGFGLICGICLCVCFLIYSCALFGCGGIYVYSLMFTLGLFVG